MFDHIVSFEPLPLGMAIKIMQAGWPIVSGTVDKEFGAGKINDYSKAIWTTDGKRITVFLKDAFMVSQSKEPDPLYSERKKQLAGASRT